MAFKDRYPEGLKQTIALFEKALHEIMYSDEIDKIIKHCKDKDEKAYLEDLKEAFRERKYKWYELHWIVMTNEIKSPMLFQDIIAIMVMKDHMPLYKGEDE